MFCGKKNCQWKEVKYFKMKQKVLKNSLHGQIWSDFEKVSLKISEKA
jgi:hypothetical protein